MNQPPDCVDFHVGASTSQRVGIVCWLALKFLVLFRDVFSVSQSQICSGSRNLSRKSYGNTPRAARARDHETSVTPLPYRSSSLIYFCGGASCFATFLLGKVHIPVLLSRAKASVAGHLSGGGRELARAFFENVFGML